MAAGRARGVSGQCARRVRAARARAVACAQLRARRLAAAARTVDLGHVAAALDADAHVHVGEAGAAEQQHRLKHLEAQDLGLNQLQRDACTTQRSTRSAAARKHGAPAARAAAAGGAAVQQGFMADNVDAALLA